MGMLPKSDSKRTELLLLEFDRNFLLDNPVSHR